MISNNLANEIKKKFKYNITADQHKLINSLANFADYNNPEKIFIVKGYAGTGKTSVVSTFVQLLPIYNIPSVLLAPTGKAAKSISQITAQQAFTIHKFIYRQQTSNDGKEKFVLNKNFHKNTIFWVEEASMISNQPNENAMFGSGALLCDLIYYVFSGNNCRLVFIGDSAQLPPINYTASPALKKSYLKKQFKVGVNEHTLTQVVRQSLHSGIYHNATILRRHLIIPKQSFPTFNLSSFNDIKRISNFELQDCITESYQNAGIKNTTIISSTNKRVNIFNISIRNKILDYLEPLEVGEYLMVVKNNYFYWKEENDFIANGEIVKLVKIFDTEKQYNFEFADVLLQFLDRDNKTLEAKILLNVLQSNTPALSQQQSKELYNNILADFEVVKNKREKIKQLRNNEYFNALQVKYAYAITCHKAQGGQWDSVFVDQGYLPDSKVSKEYIRWIYTAFTRAIKNLYLVNFRDSFFL